MQHKYYIICNIYMGNIIYPSLYNIYFLLQRCELEALLQLL